METPDELAIAAISEARQELISLRKSKTTGEVSKQLRLRKIAEVRTRIRSMLAALFEYEIEDSVEYFVHEPASRPSTVKMYSYVQRAWVEVELDES